MPPVKADHIRQARILVAQIRERKEEAGYSDLEFYLGAQADVSDDLLAFAKEVVPGLGRMLGSRDVVFTQPQRLWIAKMHAAGEAAIANAEQS